MNLSQKGTILSIKQIAKRTVEAVIKVPDDFNFSAGQYIWLMLPELKYPDIKGNTRMFSVASSPNRRGELDIVFRAGKSGYKRTLTEMTPGAKVIFSGPYGSMELPEDNSSPLALVAGGVGIAPFISMVRFSTETASGHKITLVYANASREEAVYLDELAWIEKENSNFKLFPVFGPLRNGELKKPVNGYAGRKALWSVIGPQGFVDFVGKFLNDAGIPLADISFEQFYPSSDMGSVLEQRLEVARVNKYPFFLAVESASDHIIITDTNGVILYANKGAEKMTGYTLEEMKGNTPRLWGGLMSKDFYKDLWRKKKYELQPFSSEVRNRRKNQEEYYSIMHTSPIFDENGILIGFVATEEDITKLKELDRAKSEFISIASHQLRTPITGLNWTVEALQFDSGKLSSKQKEYLDNLAGQSKRLIKLVEDLLNISRIELGSPVLADKQIIEIGGFVDEFIKGIEPYATLNKHTITLENKAGGAISVEMNERSLNNVMQNLVTNAIDYSPENTTVMINLEKSGDALKISVSNKGPIIPKEEQARLFERFYRGEGAKKIKPEGTGLGLYLVRTIIEKIGGKVGVESQEGQDTCFWFTIPLK